MRNKVNINHVFKNVTMTVNFKGMTQFKIKLFFVKTLLIIISKIFNCDIRFEESNA